MKKIILILFSTFLFSISNAQINSSKVYWVGHSLISHTDVNTTSSKNLIHLMTDFSQSEGTSYAFHQHTTPGAPIGWNWGANTAAWNNIEPLIHPLINTTHSDYGTFDVMVVTEGVNVKSSYDYWSSGFYARKFFNAAKNANSNTRFFIYESWHHFNASDNDFRAYYGPISSFNWKNYMLEMQEVWQDIIDESSSPTLGTNPSDYTYQGASVNPTDPGLGDDSLNVQAIPTGKVLVAVFDRMDESLASDDWNFNGNTLTKNDFFVNPLANFPTDSVTKIRPDDPLDDIHPSAVLVYLNALTHYSVIYQTNPSNLPLRNGVPENIASIFKEVVWQVVKKDKRTGVTVEEDSTNAISDKMGNVSFSIFPNPTKNKLNIKGDFNNLNPNQFKIYNLYGREVMNTKSTKINISKLENGVYFIKVFKKNNIEIGNLKFIKQ